MISKKIFLYLIFIFSYILSGYSTELDKVISQIDEYNQNVNSRQDKYNLREYLKFQEYLNKVKESTNLVIKKEEIDNNRDYFIIVIEKNEQIGNELIRKFILSL